MANNTIFYIADHQIDLSRSVIIKDDSQTQIEPKVLQVLFFLAQRQNEVVTHKEIMDLVWQGTEVVPNALQRCIAILRKALGDDARSPTIIATHPKIGYRLVAQVRWPQGVGLKSEVELSVINNNKRQYRLLTRYLVLCALLILVVAFVFWSAHHLKKNAGAKFNALPDRYARIEQLTRTDAHESHVVFTSDAKYLVFNRYAGSCKSHIWARHLQSGNEHQLTSEPGQFGAVSFTADGRELVFAANSQCEDLQSQNLRPEESQICWGLATLDLSMALTAPQIPHVRYQCHADRIRTPKAHDNHQYTYLEAVDNHYQLMHYNDLSKELKPFYRAESQSIYHFDYDPKHQRFAVFARDNNFHNILTLLDETGQVLSREIIRHSPDMSRYQQFFGNFEPQGEYLLAVSNNRLYKIGFNGQIRLVQTPTNNLMSIAKHPTEKTLLAVLGNKDVDIAQITLGEHSSFDRSAGQVASDLNQMTLPFSSFARTSAQERHALFQPNGNKVAFISDRTGTDQLWIWHQGEASQLSFGPHRNSIHSYAWSPDGSRLAWSRDDALAMIDLNGIVQVVNADKPIYSVLSWYQENQFIVLLNTPDKGDLYHLNIEQNQLTPFGIDNVEFAWVVQNRIIYNNNHGEVFSRSLENKNNEITQLSGLKTRAMFISGQFIYSVDQPDLMLNQYDLQGQLVKPMLQLKPLVWKVTGLKREQLLISQLVAIDNDVVMLQ